MLNFVRRFYSKQVHAHLSHVGHHAEGVFTEGFMQVATHHIDPGQAVTCIRVCFIQAHHVGQVGQF